MDLETYCPIWITVILNRRLGIYQYKTAVLGHLYESQLSTGIHCSAIHCDLRKARFIFKNRLVFIKLWYWNWMLFAIHLLLRKSAVTP